MCSDARRRRCAKRAYLPRGLLASVAQSVTLFFLPFSLVATTGASACGLVGRTAGPSGPTRAHPRRQHSLLSGARAEGRSCLPACRGAGSQSRLRSLFAVRCSRLH
jgi:hypothetical protein